MRSRFVSGWTISTLTLVPACPSLAAFRVERIASGLNQPTYITQAPGDPANILYFTERTSNTIGGFGANNQMGKVWKYDVNTQTKTLVLDLSSRRVTNDDGLQTIAFHPDFNNPGTPGYQHFYVASAQYPNPGNAIDRVEEYAIGAGGTASLTTRGTVLQYTNNAQNNHTVDWIGFDPNATGAARNYLYITTGDSSFGNNYNGGISPTGRPSQNPADVRGKLLRVDITPGAVDAYSADNNKNFAIPSSNPYPAWNSTHSGTLSLGSTALGEVYVSGLRNSFRASFDRATSDIFMGDVGENSVEELDFLKAGTNTGATTPAVDYGWPQREGTNGSGVGGAPQTQINPFYPAGTSTSLQPIQQFPHVAGSGGEAIIGGYVYHGPVTELQGKYFYSDFVRTGKIWMLDFDRNTATGSFNGNNGTLTDVSALFASRVFDPNNPAYTTSTDSMDIAGLDHIVSYGEDNAGNLYIVDMGNRSGSQSFFDGEYPAAGLGEIFRVTTGTFSSVWNNTGSGTWTPGANWTGGVPGMVGDQATFGSKITTPATVTNDLGRSVSTITFDNTNSYTIAGPGTVTLQADSGTAFINVNNGTHTIAAPVIIPGNLTITTGSASAQLFMTWTITDASGDTVTKLGPGAVQFVSLRAGTLAATEGTVRISSKVVANSPAGTTIVNNLVIGGGGGKVDLTNNSMIIDYTGPAGTLESDTRNNLQSGKLFSSLADTTKRLGYGDNALLGKTTFAGQTPDSSSILIKYTYAGDADLDGDADGVDIGTWATNFTGELGGAGTEVWTQGDWDYDGDVDGVDAGLWAQAFTGELGGAGLGTVYIDHPISPGAAAILQSLGITVVPEPTACLLLGLPFAAVVGRRRRR